MNMFINALKNHCISTAIALCNLLLFSEFAGAKDLSIKPNYQGKVCITGRAYKHVTILTRWWHTSFHPVKNAEVALNQGNLSPSISQAISNQLQMFREADKKNSLTTRKTAYYAEFTVPSEDNRTHLFNIGNRKIRVSDETAILEYERCRFLFVNRFLLSRHAYISIVASENILVRLTIPLHTDRIEMVGEFGRLLAATERGRYVAQIISQDLLQGKR